MYTQKYSVSGGTPWFCQEQISQIFPESTAMFCFGTNEDIFHAEKAQMNDLFLATAAILSTSSGFEPPVHILIMKGCVSSAWVMVYMSSLYILYWGRCGSGGKSCCLAVGGLPVRSHPGCVEVSQSKTPNP